jgi:hypothetical protein
MACEELVPEGLGGNAEPGTDGGAHDPVSIEHG